MMGPLAVLSLCFVAVSAVPSLVDEWSTFKAVHGKKYDDPYEEYRRMGIYMEKKRMIDQHNERYRQGLVSYTLGMNHFGDMLSKDISARLNGLKKPKELMATETRKPSPILRSLPKAVDWRKKGAVTPVKNQGDCGSCWAFSVTGSLEGHMFLKTGKLVSLSEQNLIDCANRRYENEGCDGGLMYNGFKYIIEHGIDSEDSYPYKGQDLQCKFNKSNVAGTVKKYMRIDEDEAMIREVVATEGPVSVAVNADYDTFFHYKSGIYDDDDCNGNQLNHGMLIVGYGQEGRNKYWLLKNSWGTQWGEGGYMKIARDRSNICGIASDAGYPIV